MTATAPSTRYIGGGYFGGAVASATSASPLWTSADLLARFYRYLGRGNGGVMQADELWTDEASYDVLADAQEIVFGELAPVAPHAFVSPPMRLVSTDGGVTYTFPAQVYPFAHVEVYAQETGGRVLHATSYGNAGADFVIEGARIRTPGNRARAYTSGPWGRATVFPDRLSDTVEPSIDPAPARALILWKALELATEVSGGAMDPTPWREHYASARQRFIVLWQTQYQSMGAPSLVSPLGPWWLNLDAFNGGA